MNSYIVEENRMQKKNVTMFIVYILCLLSALFFSITQISIIGIVATVIICAYTIQLPDHELFQFLFGLQFLRAVIRFQFGSASYVFILLVYVCLIFRMIRRRYVIKEFITIFGLFILDVVSSGIDGIFNIGDNINWIGSLAFVVYILICCKDKIKYERMLIYFCLAEWIICLINICAEIKTFGYSLVPGMYGIYTEQLGAFAFGKAYAAVAGGNGISFNNALAIALCFMQLPREKEKTKKLFYIISIIFFAYTGMMVVSRGFYIEILLFGIMYILSLTEKPSRFIGTLVGIVIIGAFFYFYAYGQLNSVFLNVSARFESGNADRTELINQAQLLLENNLKVLLFGGGSYYPETYGFTAHNVFWDSAVSLGIVGMIVYWFIIIKTVVLALKGIVVKKLQVFIPIIMLVSFKMISGSIRDVGLYYFIALVVFFAIDYSKERY